MAGAAAVLAAIPLLAPAVGSEAHRAGLLCTAGGARNERLIALIDGLAASTPPSEEADPKFDELTTSPLSSLRHLATTILSVSHHFMADASLSEVESLGPEVVVGDFGPIKHSNG